MEPRWEQQRMDTNRPSMRGVRACASASRDSQLLSVRPLPLPPAARRPSGPLVGEGL